VLQDVAAWWRVYFYPGAQVVHVGGQSSDKFGSDILFHLYLSRYRFIRKHRGTSAASTMRAVIGLGALIRVCVFSAGRILRPADPITRHRFRFHYRLLGWAVSGVPPPVIQQAIGD